MTDGFIFGTLGTVYCHFTSSLESFDPLPVMRFLVLMTVPARVCPLFIGNLLLSLAYTNAAVLF